MLKAHSVLIGISLVWLCPPDGRALADPPDGRVANVGELVEEPVTLSIGELLAELPKRATVEQGQLAIASAASEIFSARLRGDHPLRDGTALEFSVQVDPVADDRVAADIDTGIVLGMPSTDVDANRFIDPADKVVLELKEFGDRYRFTIVLDGQTISFWNRMRSENGFPNVGTRQPGQPYLLKIVAIPRGEQTGLRFFVEHGDRPLRLFKYDDPEAQTEHGEFVTEWRLDRRLDEHNFLGLYVRNSGTAAWPVETVFSDLTVRTISVDEAEQWLPADDFVMANLNYDHPTMTAVKAARDAGDMPKAKSLFVEHFRTRQSPHGPAYDREMARETAHGKEANWREVSDNAIDGIYGKLSWFHGFSQPGELSRENGLPRWTRDPGFLNRHYHWVVMTHAWERTGEAKYARRLGDEVIDYVQQEPTVYYDNPNLGGQLDVIDGTVINEHMLWTGNIGRRLELTWWQMFEVMRTSQEFSEEAIFHFFDGVIRQCRLLTNPTVFQEWDDSGLHGAMALAKSGMLFEMCDEAPLWSDIGWGRINTVMDVQFHPDGSHVSLSTGYAWATIKGFEEFYLYIKESGGTVPERMESTVSRMYAHPFALLRPGFGNVDLNDGGWSPLTHLARGAHEIFPERTDFEFFATEGESGTEPSPASMYFPNAGHYLFRTGWGPRDQYLFFGAGPWGASHGKMDALNIYAAYGPHLLIRNAGRGSYSGVGNTVHAGKSLSFNGLSPDWAQENSVPHWKREKAIGFDPPKRRFVSNDHYDYGEGAFSYGWHKPGVHTQGKWVRQVLFIKGSEPERTGYYVVIDTVEPATDRPTTWRHPWQLGIGQPVLRDTDNSVVAAQPSVAMQILPVDAVGEMTVRIVSGQETPERLGWRVYGESATPWDVPTYEWTSDGVFTKAWVIQMQASEKDWPVTSIENVASDEAGHLQFVVNRRDAGTDTITRWLPPHSESAACGEPTTDLDVVSRSNDGRVTSRLKLTGGSDSVASSRGVPVQPYQPNLSERFANVETAAFESATLRLANASFEAPAIDEPVGMIAKWQTNSYRGTGVWPFNQIQAAGEADDRQVAVLTAGGYIGQTLLDASKRPVAIGPGKSIRIRFRNLPDESGHPINLGIYLHAGEPDGPQVAQAQSFDESRNTTGEQAIDLAIRPANELAAYLPAGWENIPLYLRLHNYAGRVILDDVRVEVISE